MHHASEKKKRGNKNPQVSVRLNVRPLRANWKPVKRYEYDENCSRKREVLSPAEEQLDSTVWKTKNVRTDIVDSIAVETDPDKLRNHEMEENGKSSAGTISRCECASCERADETPTVLELSPKKTRDDLYLEKKKKLKNRKMRRDNSQLSRKPRRRHRHHYSNISSVRSLSTPPPPPPNSVISPESQHHWCKLYEDAHLATKPIDFKKIVTVPGQIGMSELEPEDPSTPPPTENAPENIHPHRSPNLPIMKVPTISPPSKVSESFYKPSTTAHQPPLVPLPPTQPQSNIVILPAPIDCPTPNDKDDKIKANQPEVPVPPGVNSDSNSSLVFMPSSPVAPPTEHALPSNSNVSMIRRMEHLFYNSESNWWFLVALVMLSIFAYRSSMDQYTCYYD